MKDGNVFTSTSFVLDASVDSEILGRVSGRRTFWHSITAYT